MVIAADYPFLNILWSMLIFFALVIWIWMMVVILSDVFRRRDIGGWAKAAWIVFMIVLPFVGVLTYLIAQHDGIAQRNLERSQAAEQQFDEQVRSAVGHDGGAPASEIEKAHQLLEQGAITRPEFEAIKEKALATR
jgi:type VI protein secretion system component VasK